MNKDSGCLPAPETFLPSKEWQQFQVSQFSCLRSRMAKHLARQKKQGIQIKPNMNLVRLLPCCPDFLFIVAHDVL